MTLDQARALREAAWQPLEWPDGIAPSLSRLALTRIVATDCEEEGLVTAGWNVELYDPTRHDAGQGDASLASAMERIAELLQVPMGTTHAPYTLGDLIEYVEEIFLERWRVVQVLAIPEDKLIEGIGRIVGRELTGEEPILTVIPEAQLAGFWERLPEPWQELWPDVPMRTTWWPLTEKTWIGVGAFVALTVLLWKNSDVGAGARVILTAIALWLCNTFIVEQPVRPVWPKSLVTVRDVALAMLAELQRAQLHWERLEADWGENRFLERKVE